MRLIDINNIDTVDFTISVTVALKLAWVDNRIPRPKSSFISVDPEMLLHIWMPDFYFYDLQEFRTLEVFQGLQGGLRFRQKGFDTGKSLIITLKGYKIMIFIEVLYMAEAEILFTCPV